MIVASLAGFAALDLSARVAEARGRSRVRWIIASAVAMGVGIWSMHFTAMLAFRLPVSIAYDLPLLLLSILIAMTASGLALYVIGRESVRAVSLLAAGVLMGLAFTGMHWYCSRNHFKRLSEGLLLQSV